MPYWLLSSAHTMPLLFGPKDDTEGVDPGKLKTPEEEDDMNDLPTEFQVLKPHEAATFYAS